MTKDPLPYDEASTWVLIRERIGWLLRERYRIPKELPANLLTVVGELDAFESYLLLRKRQRTHFRLFPIAASVQTF